MNTIQVRRHAIAGLFLCWVGGVALESHSAEQRGITIDGRQPEYTARVLSSAEGGKTKVGISLYGIDGPPVGLIVVSVDGKDRQEIRTGKPVGWEITHLDSGRELLTLRTKVGGGTGVVEEELQIFGVTRNGMRRLWKGLGLRTENVPSLASGTETDTKRGQVSILENAATGRLSAIYLISTQRGNRKASVSLSDIALAGDW